MTQRSTSITTYGKGDVVVVKFPIVGAGMIRPRPAVVVQSSTCITEWDQYILIPITSKMERAVLTFRVSILAGSVQAMAMNLLTDSVILSDKPQTVLASDIRKKIGQCPRDILNLLDASIHTVLDLP